MVPPLTTYREYFARDETNPFTDDYVSILSPYAVNPTNTTASPEPRQISWQLYAAAHEGDLTAFLLWTGTPGVIAADDPGRIHLLHSVSQYVPRLGQPPTAWDDQAFASIGDVLYGNVSMARCLGSYLHLAGDVYWAPTPILHQIVRR